MADEANNGILGLTAEIVAAHVSNNSVGASEVPNLISSVFAALSATAKPAAPEAPPQEPAVSIKQSVKQDYLVCLEDGAKLKMLKRYLRTRYDMSPEEYRAKWNLPRDYPMVAPAYAEQRRTLANAIGLGRKKVEEVLSEPAAVIPKAKKAAVSGLDAAKAHLNGADAEAPKKRGRPAKAKAEEPADA